MNMNSSPFTVEFLGTPESGKTTTIKRLKNELPSQIKVDVLQESAEIVPEIFQLPKFKGSIEAHLWMRLVMSANLLEKQCCCKSDDILLIDRGMIDCLFWDYYYCQNNKMQIKTAVHFEHLLESICTPPNLVIYLSTTPEEAIKRRGGEGRVVTKSFVKNFNSTLETFINNNVIVPLLHLDTTNFSTDEVSTIIKGKIIREYNSFFQN